MLSQAVGPDRHPRRPMPPLTSYRSCSPRLTSAKKVFSVVAANRSCGPAGCLESRVAMRRVPGTRASSTHLPSASYERVALRQLRISMERGHFRKEFGIAVFGSTIRFGCLPATCDGRDVGGDL